MTDGDTVCPWKRSIRTPFINSSTASSAGSWQADEFTIGGKFLTERAICGRFEVSRATANKALSNLVSEGLLEFKKGVGTFLKSKPPEEDIQSLASFTRNAIAAGKVPTTRS